MNKVNRILNEANEDLVFDPTKNNQKGQTVQALQGEQPTEIIANSGQPVDPNSTVGSTEIQPMTTDNVTGQAIPATQGEVDAAQAKANETNANTETNQNLDLTSLDDNSNAETKVENAITDAAKGTNSDVVNLTISIKKSDLIKDGFLVPDAEGSSANPVNQLAANPNATVKDTPLTQIGSSTGDLTVDANKLEDDFVPEEDQNQKFAASRQSVENRIRESVMESLLSEIAQSIIDEGAKANKTASEIQADLDAKLNILAKEPAFSDMNVQEDFKDTFTYNKSKTQAEPIEVNDNFDKADEIKKSGEEAGKSNIKPTSNELPLAKAVIASEIAKSKSDSYQSISVDKDIIKKAGDTPKGNKEFRNGSETPVLASELKGEKQDTYDSIAVEKDQIKQMESTEMTLTQEEMDLIKEYREYKKQGSINLVEADEAAGENHLEDVANADMDTPAPQDLDMEATTKGEELDNIVETTPEECKGPDCENKEGESAIAKEGEVDPLTGNVPETFETVDDAKKSTEGLLSELDQLLADIYEAPDHPDYSLNVNINTDNKGEAVEGVSNALKTVADFVDGILDNDDNITETPVATDVEGEDENIESEEDAKEDNLAAEMDDTDENLEELEDNVEAISNEIKDDAEAVEDIKENDEDEKKEIEESVSAKNKLHESTEDEDVVEAKYYSDLATYLLYGDNTAYDLTDEDYKKADDFVNEVQATYGDDYILTDVLDDSDFGRPWTRDLPGTVSTYIFSKVGSEKATEEVEVDNIKVDGEDVYFKGEFIGFLNPVNLIFKSYSKVPEEAREEMLDRGWILKESKENDPYNGESENKYGDKVKTPSEDDVDPDTTAVKESTKNRKSERNDYLDLEAKIKARREAINEVRGKGTSRFNEALKQMPSQKDNQKGLNADSWSANQFITKYKESQALNFKDLLRNGLLG